MGREDLARQSYEAGFALDETCYEPRMNLASMLVEDGEYEEAAIHYAKAIEGRPTAEAHSGRGFVLNQLGRLEEADFHHDEALRIDPNLAVVHRNRALTKARLEEWDASIESYRAAIAIEPRVSTYYSLGGLLRARGRDAEAREVYRLGEELSLRKRGLLPDPGDEPTTSATGQSAKVGVPPGGSVGAPAFGG